jgi:hypothetical protein
MNNNSKKGAKEKYSIQNPSPRLLKTLQTIHKNQGGTVTYVFIQERIKFTKQSPLGITVKHKSSTSAPISPLVFQKEVKGKLVRRSPQEVLDVFQDTANDIGASYFIIS